MFKSGYIMERCSLQIEYMKNVGSHFNLGEK